MASMHGFRGGVHPYDGKELSRDAAIERLVPQGTLVYPLSQHIGAPAKPLVKRGDHVLAGQLIAEAASFVSANVHASVSGKVTKVEQHYNATGTLCDCILVSPDEGEWERVATEPQDPAGLTREQILERIAAAGVVGMGGAGFPTRVKLSPKEPDKIDTIIANCAECEPYITADYRVMLEQTDELVGGLRIVRDLFEGARVLVGIEDNKPVAAKRLADAVAAEPNIEVVPLKTKYPQGSERHLIFALTGRAINSSMLPADAGCIVDNTATFVAIYRAVALGEPVCERVVTVSGDAIARPSNFLVPTGTSMNELIEAAGGFRVPPAKVVSGGPMMGFAVFDTDFPVTKTTSALLAFSRDAVSEATPTNCIKCGRCIEACPERLVPSKLAYFAEHDLKDKFERWGGLECIECGSCSYVCPAKRHLVQLIKTTKREVIAAKRAKG